MIGITMIPPPTPKNPEISPAPTPRARSRPSRGQEMLMRRPLSLGAGYLVLEAGAVSYPQGMTRRHSRFAVALITAVVAAAAFAAPASAADAFRKSRRARSLIIAIPPAANIVIETNKLSAEPRPNRASAQSAHHNCARMAVCTIDLASGLFKFMQTHVSLPTTGSPP